MTMNIRRDLSWDDLRLIRSIGEKGGLAGAAIDLKLNHSTVSRRLAAVEEALGVALFDRRRLGYVPTPAGKELVDLAGRIELDVRDVTRRVMSRAYSYVGELRISTSDVLMQDLLAPIIVGFQRANPRIQVEILVGNEHVNIARGDADIAFRATRSPPENLYGRKLADVAWAVYGARSIYAGRTLTMDELFDERWVTYDGSLSGLRANAIVRDHIAPELIALKADSVFGVTSAVAAGTGVAFLPCSHGDFRPELVRVSPVDPEPHDSLWVLTHPDLRRSERVSAFLAYCIVEMEKLRPRIEARQGKP